MTEHLDENLPFGALPKYDYPPGTQFAFVDEEGVVQTSTQPERQHYFTCPLCLTATEADVPRFKRALLDRLPAADHQRVIRAGSARGIGCYVAKLP